MEFYMYRYNAVAVAVYLHENKVPVLQEEELVLNAIIYPKQAKMIHRYMLSH